MARSTPCPKRTAVGVTALLVGAAVIGVTSASGAGQIPLAQRFMRSGELAGYHATAPPAIALTAAAWGKSIGEPAEAAKVQRAGFVQGGIESLAGPAKASAFSMVILYRTAAAARSEIARHYRTDAADKTAVPRKVTVPGIPGATGLAQDFKSGPDQSYVTFSDGPYWYYSTILAKGANRAPAVASLIKAARAQYKRVHGQASAGG
jgi:hypothetical protein